jgi:sugar lactone lactonase YvrE
MTIACDVKARDGLGESPVWCTRTRMLWWVDITKPCLQSFDPSTGGHRVIALPGRFCGCIALRAAGGLVLAIDRSLHAFNPESGALTHLAAAEPDQPENRFNDGRCDRRGRLWIGTMDADIRQPSGSFYRVGPDRAITRQFGDVLVPNSTAFSPDDRTLYFADSPRHQILAFDFDVDAGTISNRRVFVDLTHGSGVPDGSCVDAEGFLWNAEFAGLRLVRYAPDGGVERTVEMPVAHPTCCCFGGENLDTLYVTSASFPLPAAERQSSLAGSLFSLRPGVRGLPEAEFGG